MRYETKILRAGQKPEKVTGAITTPIFQTSTYALERVGKNKGFDYSRSGTPTSRALEEALTELEGGKGCVTFSSGLAAVDALMHTLSPGDHVLSCDDLYGGTRRQFDNFYNKMGIDVQYVDMTDIKNIKNNLRKETRYVFIETPSNPTLKMVDIAAAVKAAKKLRKALVVVDNTFQTPYLQRPFELGADIVVHSLTKFISGHHDVIGGAVIARVKSFVEKMKFALKTVGTPLSPLDSYLTIRGLKTLAVRMDRINKTAMKVAKFLESNRKVSHVIFPGLKSHPQYRVGKKQMTGPGGMISFELKGGVKAGKRCMNKVKIWILAESLGGCDSLITHPASMTHASVAKKTREALGITDGFVRLSVGLEDPQDLIDDLKQAIK